MLSVLIIYKNVNNKCVFYFVLYWTYANTMKHTYMYCPITYLCVIDLKVGAFFMCGYVCMS